MTPLRKRMLNRMTLRGFAQRTQETYLGAVIRLARKSLRFWLSRVFALAVSTRCATFLVVFCAYFTMARYRFDTEAAGAVKLLTMRPSQALSQHRDAVYLAATRYRVANPRVFGSALHGDDHDDSDLDLLVDTLPGTTLLD
jgi:hypothetical protein